MATILEKLNPPQSTQMLEENQKLDDIFVQRMKAINANFFKYLKIIALTLVLPMWIVLFVNGGVTLWKMLTWMQSDIPFWTIKEYAGLTIIISIIIPIVYLMWFYYLTVKRTLLHLYEDLLVDWNKEIGKFCAKYLIELEYGEEGNKSKFDIAVLLSYINRKLDYLPKILQWVLRKLMDQIPFVEFVNSFDYEDLKAKNEEKLSNSIADKISAFELDVINAIVPKWFFLLIPINLILLFTYIKL